MKKAAEILARLLDRNPGGPLPFPSLFGGWQELAGPSLAEHCRVYEVRHHNLLVEADHPGWMQLLLMQKKPILARIRQRFPQLEIREIKVRVQPAGRAADRAARAPGPAPAPAAAPSPAPSGAPTSVPASPAPSAPPAEGTTGQPEGGEEAEQALAAVGNPELREKLRLLLRELRLRGGGSGRTPAG